MTTPNVRCRCTGTCHPERVDRPTFTPTDRRKREIAALRAFIMLDQEHGDAFTPTMFDAHGGVELHALDTGTVHGPAETATGAAIIWYGAR